MASPISPQDSQIIAENERAFQTRLPEAYMTPQVGLVLYSICFQTWGLLRHTAGDQDRKKVDDKLKQLNMSSIQLGNNLAVNGVYSGDWRMYGEYVGEIMEIWYDMMGVKNSILGWKK